MKLLGNYAQGLLFVVSAPAGTGKSTLITLLLDEFPDAIAQSCSCTTREPRPNELARQDYYFLSIEEFEKKIDNNEFLEHAKVFGNYYGTLRVEVKRLQEKGKHVVLVIDTQGAMKLKAEKKDAVFIFIRPPSLDELRNRLFRRRTETDEKIEERLNWAHQEMALASEYDYDLINDDLSVTYQVLRSIFIAEEHKRRL